MGVRSGGFSGVLAWTVACVAACGARTESYGDFGAGFGRDGGADANGMAGGTGYYGTGGAVGTGGSVYRSRCGNGRIDGDEMCDGNNFNGETCSTITMTPQASGTLRCSSSCTFDASGCYVYSGVGGVIVGGTTGSGGMVAFGGYGALGGYAGTGGYGGYGGSAGSSMGDPHMMTADGLEYEFQAVGEFVLLEDVDDRSFEIQVRQQPYQALSTLSVNTAIAASVAGDRVMFTAGESALVRVNGAPQPLTGALELPHGGILEHTPEGYSLTWPSGEAIRINASFSELLNVTYRPSQARKRQLRGLLGIPDGNRANDLTTRTGETITSPPDPAALYEFFGMSWRVAPSESLFDYAPGESTATFTDVNFPRGARPAACMAQVPLEDARKTCLAAGVIDAAALRACSLDVAITGEEGFAKAAR